MQKKLAKANKFGEEMGYTKDGERYQNPDDVTVTKSDKMKATEKNLASKLNKRVSVMERQKEGVEKAKKAALKIQSQMRGKLAKRQSVVLRDRQKKEDKKEKKKRDKKTAQAELRRKGLDELQALQEEL